jgi:hypothetical protein
LAEAGLAADLPIVCPAPDPRSGAPEGGNVGDTVVSVQERVDDVQNKLAAAICNAELALEMVDGAARERVEAILRASWTASRMVAALPLSSVPARRAS